MTINKNGLNRYIPESVQREVRRRSKFGCVICREALTVYEHIIPTFADATEHNPENICLLCGTCHSAVTNGHRSKASVFATYKRIQSQSAEEAGHPKGWLEFHQNSAELVIGGLRYMPMVKTILRYHGEDLIRIVPGDGERPDTISAAFYDQNGQRTLELCENTWQASVDSWDVDLRGSRITVRMDPKHIALQLRLDPPGRIVIEHLDMRINDAHILVSETNYAVGRYLDDENIFWTSVNVRINGASEHAAAIELTTPDELKWRILFANGAGTGLGTVGGDYVILGGVGCLVVPLGISIASRCGSFHLLREACGAKPLSDMRAMLKKDQESFVRYIGTPVDG